jgi:hypothetical protein
METVTPLPAASLATGTLVRLLPENSIIHNHKYFVLCLEVGPSRRGTIVSASDGRGFRFTLKHKSRYRVRKV